MLTNTLFKFADKFDWQITDQEDFTYGDHKGYLYTMMSGRNFTAIFSPVSGLETSDTDKLFDWLEDNEKKHRFLNYEITDNFLCIRLKEGLIARTVNALIEIIEDITNIFEQIDLPQERCVVCGKSAGESNKGLYLDLFCYLHNECEYEKGIDVSNEYEQVLIAELAENSEDAISVEARIKELSAEMEDYKDDFLNDLKEILAIPSMNGPATESAPYGEATVDALNLFLEQAARLGFRTKNLDNHAGYAEFGSGDEMIGLLVHLDVVPAGEGWTESPFKARLIDGKLYARGVADNKGPAIAVLYAMKALLDEGYEPPCRIRLIVGLNEESGFGCMKHYNEVEETPVAGFVPDAAFPAVYAEKGILRARYTLNRESEQNDIRLLEMKGGEAVNMVPQVCRYVLQVGQKTIEQEIEGKSSHGSRPELGENAIVNALKKIIIENVEWNDPLVDLISKYFNNYIYGEDLGLEFSDHSGKLTLNLGIIDVTDSEINLEIDIRYPVTKTGEEIINVLDKKMAEFAFVRTDYADSEPLHLGKDSKLVTTVMDVYNQAMHSDEEAVAMGGGTYARAIPNVLAFGAVFPGTPDVMHQVDEFVDLDHLYAASNIYKKTIRALAENQR